MLGYLKQSTASQTRLIGPFIDDTDFKTPETGLTIANTDIKLSANGGTVANKNSGGATHITTGMWAVTFDATDTATVGELGVAVNVAGALPVYAKFVVLEEAIYDALFAASATGFNASGQVAVASIANGAITAAAIATNAIDDDALSADAVTAIQSGLATAAALDTVDNFLDTEIADIQARLPAALSSGRIKADVEAVGASTTAVDRMKRALNTEVLGTVGTGSTTTSVVASSLDPASVANDQFVGLVMCFDKDTTTTALRGQKTIVTDYVHSTLTFTVTALTNAPASGDTFVLV